MKRLREQTANLIEEQHSECYSESTHSDIDYEDSLYLIRRRNGEEQLLNPTLKETSIEQGYLIDDGKDSAHQPPPSLLSIQFCDTVIDNNLLAATSVTKESESLFEESDIKLLSFLLFCVNYGFSIEMVFISPFFFKVDTPDVLDTIIWLIPPFIIRFILPLLDNSFKARTVQTMKCRKLFILIFAASNIIGQFLMAFSMTITVNWISLADEQNSSTMMFGIIGFIFQDVGHEVITMIVAQYSEDSISTCDGNRCSKYFSLASSSGMILAFLISSVLAFNVEVWDVENFMVDMQSSYFLGGVLFLAGFIWTLFGLKPTRELPHGLNQSLKAEYTLNTLLPGIHHVSHMTFQQKIIVFSHFLMQGNLLLINVYATLWMGATLLHSNLQQLVGSNKVRDYLFDLGISWGALILCCASFLFYLSSRVQQSISQSSKTQSLYLCLTNLSCNLSFIYTYFSENFYCSCISLLLWGIAQDAFDSIPFKLSQALENTSKVPAYLTNQMLELSKFSSQILFWFVMPALFLFWDSVDDISFSLLQGSLLGTIGSIVILGF